MRRVLPWIALAAALAAGAQAETLKVGVFRGTSASGAIYVAKEKGYFAQAGLDTEVVVFDAGEAVAVATVSGAIDIGAAGVSAAFYNLASQGSIRVVSGINRDVPGFQAVALVASNHAYDGGLHGFADLAGRSVALTTVGSTFHYAVGLIEEKLGLDVKSVKIIAAQGLPNVASAVAGGQADSAIVPTPFAAPLIEKGAVKLVGYVADIAPSQVGIAWVTKATADTKADMVRRYLAAYRKGVHDYHAAFTGPGETRKDGPTAPEVLAIIAKYTGQTAAQIDGGISYIDPEGRIDARDIQHQIDWFRAQGMIKGEIDAATLIDKRYATTLP
ncbi:MAG TPA: ABC transporter substrate-binding protein [Stellaceae bacterium]|nr:ABC transporter substrate-binding protein [Stellaceae bacterium]